MCMPILDMHLANMHSLAMQCKQNDVYCMDMLVHNKNCALLIAMGQLHSVLCP